MPDEPTQPHDMAREIGEIDPEVAVHRLEPGDEPADVGIADERVSEDER